jgi:dTDP-4-amino-4,6-dideoxy-D-galactose acyltransferase
MLKQHSNPVHATLVPLEWENQLFSINSSIVSFAETAPLLTEALLAEWSRVQAKVPAHRTDWLDALQGLDFKLVEGEVDMELDIRTQTVKSAVVAAQPEEIPGLLETAARAFKQSRFRPPWYQKHDSEHFYAKWVENAVLSKFDNQCLLLKDDYKIRGFITLRQLNENEARIGLLAGPGAGNELLTAAQFWGQQRSLQTLLVATQMSNRAALRCYIRNGATIKNTAFWLYR